MPKEKVLKAKSVKPLGYRVLIKDKVVEEKKGSIYLPDATKEADEYGQVFGSIVDMGELAFTAGGTPKNPAFFSLTVRPNVGDTVIFDKYTGTQCWYETEEHGRCRMIRDDDVLAIVEGAE